MNDLTPTHYTKPSLAYSAGELTVELAKVLALVAPITMTAEQQELWLRAAIDALQDIRPAEVSAISAELRRSVTRPAQIVPRIAELVARNRAEACRATYVAKPLPAAPPRPFEQPFDRAELDSMPPEMRSLGLKYGFLEYRNGQLVETRAA